MPKPAAPLPLVPPVVYSAATRQALAQVMQVLRAEPMGVLQLCQATKLTQHHVRQAMALLEGQGLAVPLRYGTARALSWRAANLQDVLEKATKLAQNAQVVELALPAKLAFTLQDALELYSRLGMGQWGPLVEAFQDGTFRHASGQLLSDAELQALRTALDELKRCAIGFESNASWSIFGAGAHPKALPAWAVYKALRFRLSWDRTSTGGGGVSFDEPSGLDAGTPVVWSCGDAALPDGYQIRIQMPLESFSVLEHALKVVLRLARGDLSALIDPVAGVCPSPDTGQDGRKAPPPVPGLCDQALRRAEAVLGQVQACPTPSAEMWRCRELLALLAAMPKVVADAKDTQGHEGALAVAEGGVPQPWHVRWGLGLLACPLDAQLPPNTWIRLDRNEYQVLTVAQDGSTLVRVGTSCSLQTAAMMAVNESQARPARAYSF